MPMRGSLSSRISSARSRWIWSATRKLRLGMERCLWRIGLSWPALKNKPRRLSRAGFASRANSALQRSGDFLDFEELELIALGDVVVVLQLDAALEAFLDFAHIVLHALERLELAGVDDHVVAQQAEARVARDV